MGLAFGGFGVLLAPAEVVLVVVEALGAVPAVLPPAPQPAIVKQVMASRSSENAVVRALEVIRVTITVRAWGVNELRRVVSN